MPLFYVTGVSGSGKSAVLRELRARGHEAHGVDEHGFGTWVNRVWTLDAEKIRALRSRSDQTETAVFLCGTAEGDSFVWDAFNDVFALVVDPETIEQRIGQRPDRFGKRPQELRRILEWQTTFEADYRRFGAVVIDATKPVEAVVDELLAAAERDTD